eukprot:1480822-Pyramimonas_sp.AAC.1
MPEPLCIPLPSQRSYTPAKKTDSLSPPPTPCRAQHKPPRTHAASAGRRNTPSNTLDLAEPR